jgi:hypothetical protein
MLKYSLKVAVQGPDFWPTPSTYNVKISLIVVKQHGIKTEES